MRKSAFPRPVDDIVPYETPSLLVDTVENVTENSVVCSVIVGNRDCVCYSEDKELPVMALLELMAQTFSVWNVFYGAKGNRKKRFGLLVDVERFIVTRNSDLPKGMELRVSATLEQIEGGYVKFNCDVKDVLENEIIGSAKLTGIVPSDKQMQELTKRRELANLY